MRKEEWDSWDTEVEKWDRMRKEELERRQWDYKNEKGRMRQLRFRSWEIR